MLIITGTDKKQSKIIVNTNQAFQVSCGRTVWPGWAHCTEGVLKNTKLNFSIISLVFWLEM